LEKLEERSMPGSIWTCLASGALDVFADPMAAVASTEDSDFVMATGDVGGVDYSLTGLQNLEVNWAQFDNSVIQPLTTHDSTLTNQKYFASSSQTCTDVPGLNSDITGDSSGASLVLPDAFFNGTVRSRRGHGLPNDGNGGIGPLDQGPYWAGYGHDAQHTGLSQVPSQPLNQIHWHMPVDLFPPGGTIYIHYGSPMVTPANTVIVPVKIGMSDGFRVEGHNATDGSLIWTQATDYSLPPHGWTPSYSPTLTPQNRLYMPGAGGTVYYRDDPDSPTSSTGQLAFYGISNYDHSLDSKVYIDTPITSDANGDIYFGFTVTGNNSLNLQSGIARIGADGGGRWIDVGTASGDQTMTHVVMNCAFALSNSGDAVYGAVSNNSGHGYLVKLDSTTLAPMASVFLRDPGMDHRSAGLPDDATASPTVGPDGDVYYGVLENPFPYNHDRGWLLHFSSDLTQYPTPGAFGWDDTVAIVPSSAVASYTGSASYLLMTKYNNYAGRGGDGINKVAVIDPTDTQLDPITGLTIMKEVLTIAGQTPDPDFPDHPGAVREWCINAAAVDPFTDSILVNSEDGRYYRWDLTTNTLTEGITLTTATGEAYTPTVIGVDGTAYAINNATLFAVGL
jgi:hypothetical protein